MPQNSQLEIQQEIQNLSPSAVVELFVLKMGARQEDLCFHAGTNELRSNVVWQGQTYMALPIQTEGFDISTKGELPRPKLAIANIKGLFSALIRQHEDLVGLRLIRKRTFARYLDSINFPNGNPEANATVCFPDDVWFINQKIEETKHSIIWELASAFDLQGVQLPKRQIIQNYCQWAYRSGECGYDGPYFDINDKPCSRQNEDVCSKRLSSCKARFDAINTSETKPILPFGGFPGATRKND